MAKSAEPVWIETELALAIHDRQLAEHGGPIGLCDTLSLESALARVRNQWSYGETDLCQLAAAYAYGVARNHPFADGNKRTAWVLSRRNCSPCWLMAAWSGDGEFAVDEIADGAEG